ncbi:MAG: DUF4956 domain-containing protein, partial [Bdellovibrionales bacterium]|nr:DUF4956 domain-containing protein [Bdellovibrionales bacterium]
MDTLLSHSELKATFANAHLIDVIYAGLLAFFLGACIAITYVRSFRGLSYSNAFIQSLVFAPILTAIAMQAIGDSVARGLGLMGAFSLLRFRTNIKDTRDMMFIFAALATGLACGVYAYGFAVISLGFFCFAVLILNKVPFSLEADYNAILKFQIDADKNTNSSIDSVLQKNSSRFHLISARELAQGEKVELTYHIKVSSHKTQYIIIQELGKIPSINGIHLFLQEGANE